MTLVMRSANVTYSAVAYRQQRAGISLLNKIAKKTSVRAARGLDVRAQSSATATQATVRVRFSTHYQAAFGESLKVVGSNEVVGAWDITSAPDMSWTDGNVWALDLDLPKQSDFEYKIVHVHYNGTSWESCQNRLFQAGPALAEQAALDISCRYNHPELTVVQLAPIETQPSLQSKDTWNPAAQGLPADLTDELSQKDVEETPIEEDDAPEIAGTRSWADVQQDAPLFQTEGAVAVGQALQESAVQETAAPEKLSAKGPGAAAGAVALALGAGVVMSALAIDLTDAAVTGAILAAGATFLPAKDAKDAQKAVSDIVSGGLNATEALARGFGLKSHVEQRADKEATLMAQSAPPADSVQFEEPSLALDSETEEQPDTDLPTEATFGNSALSLGTPAEGSAEKASAESIANAEDRQEVAY